MRKLLLSLAFISFVSFIYLPVGTANAQCQADFTFTVSGDSVLFNDISTFSSPVIHSWDFGNGNGGQWSSPPNPLSEIYPYAGKYRVCLTISDTMPSTCHSTFCDSVTITNAPHYPCDATFSASSVDTMAYAPVYFHSNLPTFYCAKWYWDFGDGSYDNTGNNAPYHQYVTPAKYNVCLITITNSGDTCTYCDTINTIPCNQLLNVSFTHTLNSNTGTFTSNCSGSLLSNPWHWNFGDGFTANSQNVTHTYQYNGIYNVCLTYIKDSVTACSKTFCDTLTITNASPYPCNAMFSYYPDTLPTNSVYFYDQSTMNIVVWNWSFPGGTPSSFNGQSASVSYATPGTYIAYLTVTNQSGISCTYSDSVYAGTSCGNTHAYFNMSPTSTPHVWNVVNMATGTPPISYSWNWGDGSAYSTGVNPNHTYNQAGWYNICLTITDANGCGSSYCTYDTLYKLSSTNTIISIFVTSPNTGINNIWLADGFYIYPNPTTDNLSIEAPQKAIIEILNIQGQLIKTITANEGKTNVDVSALPSGVYFIKVKTEKRIAVKKFVKE
jgi:PKD repeat protein